MTLKTWTATLTLAFTALTAGAQTAAVDVQNAWARATVKGQMATGAFMTLTAKDGARLVGASSPLGIAQIHEMKMDGGVMKMSELKDGLPLPAGQAVELKPGGYHVMLMDLKAPLPKESRVPVTLIFKDAQGAESRLSLELPARLSPPGAAASGHAMHGSMAGKP